MIATEKKVPSILMDETSVQKIVMLTENIAIVYSGMGARLASHVLPSSCPGAWSACANARLRRSLYRRDPLVHCPRQPTWGAAALPPPCA